MDEILSELDREERHVRVRVESRRYGKETTIVEGLALGGKEMEDVCKKMKRGLATGGTVKNDVIILQGDKRDEVPRSLEENGVPAASIEVI